MVIFWTVVLVVKTIVLIILLLAFLPFILLWVWLRGMIYRAALKRELRKAGLPDRFAKEAADEMRIRNFLWFFQVGN